MISVGNLIKTMLMVIGGIVVIVVVLGKVGVIPSCKEKVLIKSISPNRHSVVEYLIKQCDDKTNISAYLAISPFGDDKDRALKVMSKIGQYQGDINDSDGPWPILELEWSGDYRVLVNGAVSSSKIELNGVALYLQ